MRVHRVEGLEQPLAPLAVQIGDALAEPRDGLLDVGFLARELFEPGGKLRLFLLGHEIDAAEPLAIALKLNEACLDLRKRREARALLYAGERKTRLRRAV